MVENIRPKILWDFKFYNDKQLLAIPPDIAGADKDQNKAIVIDAAIPANSNITKMEHKKT